MSRSVRDPNLETRTARHRLPVRKDPYYRMIEPHLYLGYRKLPNSPGTWLVRRYNGKATSGSPYTVKNLTLDTRPVIADDYSDADGKIILNFAQAQDRAKTYRAKSDNKSADGFYTVADALDAYLKFIESEGRSISTLRDSKYRANALILPALGKLQVDQLTPDKLRHWREAMVKAAPRLRTRDGEKQKHREAKGEDAPRARRATANRTWTILRAALNHAFNEGKVASDTAWRKVKPFRKVDAARVRYLSVAEAQRLINACDPDFRLMVHAALFTGCRYGELCALKVGMWNPDVGTIHIAQSKSGHARNVVLTDEGRAFFREITAGRSGDEIMLRKADGTAWAKSNQFRPMNEAVGRARIKPAINFHGLRHTWASLSAMAGVPLLIIAKNLGHRDTRMCERHYAHLAPSFVADEIRKGAPKFGYKPTRKVTALR
jgi:integrase